MMDARLFQLATNLGKRVVRHARPRPYFTYYYSHEKALGYDCISRSCDQERAIRAACKNLIEGRAESAEIYHNNERLVASIAPTTDGFRVRLEK